MRRNKFHRRSEKDSGSGSHGKSRRGRTSGVTDMDLEETIVGDDNSQDGFVDKVSQDGDLADDCNERRGHPEDCTGTKTEVRYSAGFPPSSRDTAPPPPLPDSHHIVRTSEVSVSYTNVPIDLPWPPKAQHPKQIRPPSGHK